MVDAMMNRRSFVRGTLVGSTALGLGFGLNRAALAAESGKPDAGKIGDFKISLAEWSINKALFNSKVAEKEFGRAITNLDFPKIAREEFGIDGIEFVNQFFRDKAHDTAYLKDLKKRADDHGVTCVLIMIDLDRKFDMSAKEKPVRDMAVERHKEWVDAAAALGCHSIRINTGEHYSASDVAAIADSCGALTEYGDANKINIICENHGGPSSDPDALIPLMKAVGKDRFGTLPDFGNFQKNRQGRYTLDIYDAIARMMPYAKGVSAKSYNFSPDGKEAELDFARIMKIVTDAGYHGYVGIEYEGSKLSEPDGIKATKRLLESLRGAMYTP